MADPSNLMQASLVKPDRRTCPRYKLKSIVYLELGEGNGGLITDISSEGLAIQAAMALVYDQLPQIRFQLPRTKARIEVSGQIAWKSESKKTAGVQFVGLPDAARAQIEEWIALQGSCVDAAQKDPQQKSGGGREKRGQIAIVSNESRPVAPPGLPSPASSGFSIDQRTTRPIVRGGTPARDPYGDWPDSPDSEDVSAIDGRESSEDTEEQEDLREEIPAPAERSASPGLKAANAARDRMKRYLVNDRAKILLHDFVSIEAQKLCNYIAETDFLPTVRTGRELIDRLQHYEEVSELLVALMSTGCYWGERQHASIWAKLLERVSNAIAPHKALQQPSDLRVYPGLLLLYAGGIAAVACSKYCTIATLLLEPRLRGPEGDAKVVEILNSGTVVDSRLGSTLTRNTPTESPVSFHLHEFLREPLREFIPFDTDYDNAFNRFEYLLALVWVDDNPKSTSLEWIPNDAPLGRFATADSSSSRGETFVETVAGEISRMGAEWPPLRAGLIGKSLPRLRSAKKRIDAAVSYSRLNR